MQCVLSAKVIYAYICKIETHALYVSYSQCDVYVIVTISHLYTIFPSCIYIASILNAMYMHFKQTHVYAIRSTTRYITHSKYRNWSKCDVHRILNCDIYRIYFLNAMYVASACGVLRKFKSLPPSNRKFRGDLELGNRADRYISPMRIQNFDARWGFLYPC